MSDGNGRISRFLINDVLRRDGAVPEPFILPVSATITSSVINRRGYDHVLELFSQPLMRKYADAWAFGAEQVAEDGVHFNLQFDAYQDALPAWRYPDMTDHVEYLAEVVRVTIEQEMRKEAGYLRSSACARARQAGHRRARWRHRSHHPLCAGQRRNDLEQADQGNPGTCGRASCHTSRGSNPGCIPASGEEDNA